MNEISYLKENINQLGYVDGEIITYDNKKSKELGISTKDVIGEGYGGTVKFHSQYNNLVIKKFKQLSYLKNDNEFLIGRILGNNNYFIKHHNLFKKIDNKIIVSYKIVMDYINGSTIDQAKYTSNDLKQFLNDTKEACLILIKNNIIWDDLNKKNILITNQKEIKFCDYGRYRFESDSRLLAIGIFNGASDAINHLISHCSGMKNKYVTAKNAFELFDLSVEQFTYDAKVLIDEKQNNDIRKQVEDIIKNHFQKILEMIEE